MNKFIVAVFLFLVAKTFAQDTLFLTNGDTMIVKIVEILDREVRYKDFDNPELITSSINGDVIKTILKEDGSKEKFSKRLPHYIGSSFIISSPAGIFNDNSEFTNNTGNALAGLGLTIYGNLYLTNRIGLYLDFGSFRNQFQPGNLISRISEDYDSSNVTTGSGYWQTTYFIGGPQISWALGKRWTIDARALIGDFSTQKPEITLNYTDYQQTTYAYKSGTGRGHGLAYGGGFGVRFQFTRRLSVDYSYSFLVSDQVIKYSDTFTQTTIDGTIKEEITPGIRAQKVAVGNTRIGLTFTFKKR